MQSCGGAGRICYEALCQLQVKSNETRLAQIPVELSPIESGNVAGPLRRRYAQFVGYQSVVISARFAQTGFVRTLAAAVYHRSSARNAKGINGSVLGISHTRARIRRSQ